MTICQRFTYCEYIPNPRRFIFQSYQCHAIELLRRISKTLFYFTIVKKNAVDYEYRYRLSERAERYGPLLLSTVLDIWIKLKENYFRGKSFFKCQNPYPRLHWLYSKGAGEGTAWYKRKSNDRFNNLHKCVRDLPPTYTVTGN